jgi:glycosyltransferase involved in cell wall biosynthesis
VIASRVGGLPEIVVDGETGVLIPPADKDALVRALRDLSDYMLAAMGRAGRQRFLRHFTLDRMHRQIADLYESAGTAPAADTQASTS